MADESNASFPTMPVAHWWNLREKLKRSFPSTITASYLESSLDVTPRVARDLLVPLKTMGLIDGEGRVLERANRWRDDETYREVCEEIRRELYPEELLHAVPDPSSDRARVERWFASKTRAGEKQAKKMAAIYQVLIEADPSKGQDAAKPPGPKSGKPRTTRQRRAGARSSADGKSRQESSAGDGITSTQPSSESIPANRAEVRRPRPPIHINVQIHISSDATAEQIDQIFASMARHLDRDGE